MKKIILLILLGLSAVSCVDVENKKDVIQYFSTKPMDSIIAKYGEPKKSQWSINSSYYVSKIHFEDMNNTSFEGINLDPSKLDEETGFKGEIKQGGPDIYSIKLDGKSEVVYNAHTKNLRVSLQEKK